MKLNSSYDITSVVIDPKAPEEKIVAHIPGSRGDSGVWYEYGFAVTAEVGKRVKASLIQRMDNEVLRNLASFAQANTGLDFSEVVLVDGLKTPLDAANDDWARFKATKEEREASRATATRFNYTRGWYVMAEETEYAPIRCEDCPRVFSEACDTIDDLSGKVVTFDKRMQELYRFKAYLGREYPEALPRYYKETGEYV